MAGIIEIKELTKQYRTGKDYRTAVDQLTLTVEDGDIFGFVGPNGAGKTTAIRVMTTLLEATAGDVLIAGQSVQENPAEVRNLIGYMPDFFGVYHDMTVWEYLDFFAACYNLPPAQRRGTITELLELVDLTHRRDDMVESLSRGMKQRLSLARTLVHDPQVLVLDEPASGLDPRARVEIRSLLVELAKLGKTIFFSTHILADVAEICTRVGIIEAGKLVASGTFDELRKFATPHRRIEVVFLGPTERASQWLVQQPGVNNLETPENGSNGDNNRLEFDFAGGDEYLNELLAGLIHNGFKVIHFASENRDMEAVFMRATKGMVT